MNKTLRKKSSIRNN